MDITELALTSQRIKSLQNARLKTWTLTDGSSIPMVELFEGNHVVCQLACTTESAALDLIALINTRVDMIRFD